MAALIPYLLTIIGIILLSHACYSAYEHAKLSKSLSPSPSRLPTHQPLPLGTAKLPHDVALETIVSVVLICIGLVTGAEGLRPIHWRVWAGQAEKEGRGSGPYERLENRVAFVDIRAKRKDFADWMRKQGELQQSS